jgi:hypothetical protein
MLYHALTGRLPFEPEVELLRDGMGRKDVTFMTLFTGEMASRTVPVAAAAPQVPPALATWIDAMVSLDSEDRPVSAREALAWLDAIDLGVAADVEFTAWEKSPRALAHAAANLTLARLGDADAPTAPAGTPVSSGGTREVEVTPRRRDGR